MYWELTRRSENGNLTKFWGQGGVGGECDRQKHRSKGVALLLVTVCMRGYFEGIKGVIDEGL